MRCSFPRLLARISAVGFKIFLRGFPRGHASSSPSSPRGRPAQLCVTSFSLLCAASRHAPSRQRSHRNCLLQAKRLKISFGALCHLLPAQLQRNSTHAREHGLQAKPSSQFCGERCASWASRTSPASDVHAESGVSGDAYAGKLSCMASRGPQRGGCTNHTMRAGGRQWV